MSKFSDEQLRQIIDGAPDGATHYTDKTKSLNLYFKLVHMECMYCWICGKWEVYPPHGNLLSLSDLREILELRERVEELEQIFSTITSCTYTDKNGSQTMYISNNGLDDKLRGDLMEATKENTNE